jgi:hypothetical protein
MITPELYEIHVTGHICESLGMEFEGLTCRGETQGRTVLSGLLDQSALYGVLIKINSLGLKLIAVHQVET